MGAWDSGILLGVGVVERESEREGGLERLKGESAVAPLKGLLPSFPAQLSCPASCTA